MKHTATILAVAAACATLPAAAQSQYPGPQYPGPQYQGTQYQGPVPAVTFEAEARVVSAVPIRDVGTAPREECWNETVSGGNGSQVAGTVIGGIAGGLIGHQIGSGRGNTAATIAGTIGGAAVGNEVGRRNERGEEVVQRCRQAAGYVERVVGFDVVYRFQGREFSTRLPYDPGQSLPVNVTVAPAAR